MARMEYCQVCGNEFIVKYSSWKWKCCSRSCGKKLMWMNPEYRHKNVIAHKGLYAGDKNPSKRDGVGLKISKALKGRVFSDVTIRNMSKGQRNRFAGGSDKHWNWQGGITAQNVKIRNSILFQEWRKSVYERDNWNCQDCGKHGGELNAHHIKAFAEFPELRFDIDNGVTLCVNCHRKTFTTPLAYKNGKPSFLEG